MISTEHQALVQLFCDRPAFAGELLDKAVDIAIPSYDFARPEAADFTQTTPDELRADAVLVFNQTRPDGDPVPVLGIVLEVQRGRDRGKQWSWPMYLVSLRSRMRCPAVLLVVAPDPAIARWCARPIELGHPGLTLTPIVLGPDQVPKVVDQDEAAEDLELAALSVITHAADPEGPRILEALVAAAHDLDPDEGGRYADLVRAALPAETWNHLEKLMQTERREYLSDWARNNVAQGEAKGELTGKVKGKVESVLAVLSARGIEVPDDVRAEIVACDDVDRLDVWVRVAVTADSARELLKYGAK